MTYKKTGFTLSEVLITLGIIGVIAAITIPGVVQNYQKKSTATKLKKAYSNFQQAFMLSEYENGKYTTWDIPAGNNTDTQREDYYNKYFKPYLNGTKISTPGLRLYSIDGENAMSYKNCWRLSDGTSISLFINDYIWVFLDINGPNKPNKLGKDVFMLSDIDGKTGRKKNKFSFKESVSGYLCQKGTGGKYAGGSCGTMIIQNNWEMPKDYPW